MFFRSGDLGDRGERQACRWLRRRGWNLLSRNPRIGHDEIDIIAESPDGRILACIEVKSTATREGDLFRRIDGAKQRCLRRSARQIAARYPRHFVRIDLMTVHFDRLFIARIQHWPSILEARG
ncbi:MAG: YraN family protein [Phycisphaerae bacterium]|nr:YraN family protein [Phycisphaerae bacterium]